MSGKSACAIHWFRRDLRVDGNPALMESIKRCGGRVLGLYCVDPRVRSRDDFSADRFGFLLATLRSLQSELRSRGGDLLVVESAPERALSILIERLSLASVSFNREYEPAERERDARITRLLTQKHGVAVFSEADQLLVEPEALKKENGESYQVYSAFARRWIEKLASPEITRRLALQKEPLVERFRMKWPSAIRTELGDALELLASSNSRELNFRLPEAGAEAARKALRVFQPKLEDYAEQRDYPAKEGTSGLSIHLKTGSISTAATIVALGLDQASVRRQAGAGKFLSELIWREFYSHFLWHHPRVEHEAFQQQYKDIQWENSRKLFDAWKSGQTGYPIVDAAMRQFHATGRMHNRLRMIVASFLTKDLLIDWRWGERWFMKRLLDGDLAANNGGWQWAASTGCDPQPYFRIFNPVLQSRKFDPEGEFIRTWVPELRDLGLRQIHEPKETSRPRAYPKPIVSHASRRIHALRIYEASRAKALLKTSAP